MRIEQAKRLLLAENHSVTEICFDIGYESLGSFSVRFRSLTGLSPSAFRREARVAFGDSPHIGRCITFPPATSGSFWTGILVRARCKSQESRSFPSEGAARVRAKRARCIVPLPRNTNMIQRLSHATFYVLDQDAARDFYVNKLGFEVRMDGKMTMGFAG